MKRESCAQPPMLPVHHCAEVHEALVMGLRLQHDLHVRSSRIVRRGVIGIPLVHKRHFGTDRLREILDVPTLTLRGHDGVAPLIGRFGGEEAAHRLLCLPCHLHPHGLAALIEQTLPEGDGRPQAHVVQSPRAVGVRVAACVNEGFPKSPSAPTIVDALHVLAREPRHVVQLLLRCRDLLNQLADLRSPRRRGGGASQNHKTGKSSDDSLGWERQLGMGTTAWGWDETQYINESKRSIHPSEAYESRHLLANHLFLCWLWRVNINVRVLDLGPNIIDLRGVFGWVEDAFDLDAAGDDVLAKVPRPRLIPRHLTDEEDVAHI